MTKKGVCGYCLGETTVVQPLNNDPKEAELNNFISVKCPCCDGTGETDIIESEFDDDPISDDDVVIPDDLDEFIEWQEEDISDDNND